MEKKYTPGPWKVKRSETKEAFNVIGTVLGVRYKIARCPYPIGTNHTLNQREMAEAEANAQLISCAPLMLERIEQQNIDLKILKCNILKISETDPMAIGYADVIQRWIDDNAGTIAKALGKQTGEG